MILRCQLAFFVSLFAANLAWAGHSFENTAIVRTVELGGASVHVTTAFAVKALEPKSSVYTIALSKNEHQKTSWLEVRQKGQQAVLPLQPVLLDAANDAYIYKVEFSKPLAMNESVNLILDTVQTHATFPWPEQAGQTDDQALKYETDLYVLSPYKTAVQRTKVRALSPRILSYTTPEGIEFTTENPVTKSGATVTYGPYHNIPESSSAEFVTKHQKHVTVHYNHDFPLAEITTLKRAAEISHWGANLNIQDEIVLHNAGPTLKGHFSRLQFQSSTFYNRASPTVLNWFTLHLPAGIKNVYYYDQIGNVSTSRLRAAPSVPKSLSGNSNQYSIMEVRPRYPLLGGWNYTFTLGWDAPLSDSTSFDSKTGKYIVGVPVMTVMPDAVVDDAEVKIILPEGATDIEFFPPFPAKNNTISTHISYLDTVGRPALTFHYEHLTDKHNGIIYVTYKVPFSAHLRKPLAVATGLIGLFVLSMGWRRVDVRLDTKQKL
ncbi:Ribophorin I [Heliocybe sulcata]|uniref:Dolichyl-diphosphooligosaccharide--protein glycosyltransferase subunit 1 n=1 Tax=Heliocybe sulcata TaxID=5364 RepID=A0A5C3NHZ0_9AGAM|nr:Ribophorin I [Heliocybe sulcata]